MFVIQGEKVDAPAPPRTIALLSELNKNASAPFARDWKVEGDPLLRLENEGTKDVAERVLELFLRLEVSMATFLAHWKWQHVQHLVPRMYNIADVSNLGQFLFFGGQNVDRRQSPDVQTQSWMILANELERADGDFRTFHTTMNTPIRLSLDENSPVVKTTPAALIKQGLPKKAQIAINEMQNQKAAGLV